MKIAMVLRESFFEIKGGAELQALLIGKKLSDEGHEVHYVYEDDREHDTYQKEGIIYHTLKPRPKKLSLTLLNYNSFKSVLDRIKPDIVYQRVRTAYTGMAAKYCKDHGPKFVYALSSDRDTNVRYNGKDSKDWILNYLNWKISGYGIKNADRLVAQTERQRYMMKQNFGLNSLVIPNSQVVPDPPFEKESPPIIAWIANFKDWKRPELFIKLAKASEVTGAKFVMAGRPNKSSPNYQRRLEEQVEETPRLNYLGELSFEETNRLLSKASVFVNTSLPREGFPNTYIQAWMREVPIVSMSFDLDGILDKEKLGMCSHQFETMVEDVKHLIKDAKLRQAMGKRGRRFAKDNFDINKNIQKYEDLFEEMILG